MLELTRTTKIAVLSLAVPTTAVLFYVLYRTWFEDEDDDSEPCPRNVSTAQPTVIEVKIPQKDVGTIIGRQGQTIKEFQQKSGARINFKDNPKDESETRTMVIRGSRENAQAAECLVLKFLADIPVVVQGEMYAPGYALGRIIGKNGDRIRQLSRSTNTKIYVDRAKPEYRDQPRLITISGTKEQIVIAKSMIQELVDEEEQFRAKAAVMAANRETGRKVKDTSQKTTINGSGEHQPDGSPVVPPSTGSPVVIPTVPWPKTKDYVEVYVSAVADPDHFWVQLITANSMKLDQDSAAMTTYYSEPSGQSLKVKDLKEGDYVAAPFAADNTWYRAQVMGFEGSKVDLLYVDYGDSDFVEIDQLKPLSPEFTSLPIQAIECRLAGIKPSGENWTEAAIERFEELMYCSKWKVIMARTEGFQGPLPCLTLIDTNTDKDINISQVLVREGFALGC